MTSLRSRKPPKPRVTGTVITPTPTSATAWRAISAEPLAGLAALSGETGNWAEWARGVCLAAVGRYDDATSVLTRVCESAPPEPAGLAAATLASVFRQLGAHSLAVPWDETAIAGEGRAVPDGLIGRAADEIGLGNPDRAAAWLDRAAGIGRGWRDEVRTNWVRAELSLLTSDPASAVAAAGHALDLAQAAGSPRHVIKSRLFLLVALDAAGEPGGDDSLTAVIEAAARLDLRPLVWAAACAAGKAAAPDAVAHARGAVAFIDGNLPQPAARFWLDRTDIAWLRQAPVGDPTP